jgi:hypothetical protein
MRKLKTASLSEDYTDEDIQKLGCKSTKFISFESLIAVLKHNNHMYADDFIGYEVTDYGIELIID